MTTPPTARELIEAAEVQYGRSEGAHRDALDALNKRARDSFALALEALEKVEWDHENYCHACNGWKNHGHYPSCLIRRALSAMNGVPHA